MSESVPADAPVRTGRLFPGWIARPIIAGALMLALAVRLAGRLEDPPFPLDDTSFRNVSTLIFCFIAAFATWVWFCFYSGYSPRARMGVLVGTAVALIALVGVIGGLGFTRVIHFSGSMIPRLAPAARHLGGIDPGPSIHDIDVRTTTGHDFPQFLGPDRTGWIAGPPLSRDWKTTPPRLVWKRPIGDGWSGFAVVNGWAYTLEQRDELEAVSCYEVATGRPAWGHAVEARHENPLGGIGPRSTPTVFEGRVYALGATGVLWCLDGKTSAPIWQDDLRKRYGLTAADDEEMVMWGRAASPLIVDRMVVVPGGGPQGKAKNLVAFELETGRLLWEAENLLENGTADQIAYASPALATLAGRRQILIVNESTASGHDAATGKRLWSHPWPGHSNGNASASQAVAIGDNQVLLTKGYSGGAELIELVPAASGDELETKTVWKVPRVLQTKFTNVVVHEGHAYGLSEGILECVELEKGRRRWKSGRYGHGQILGVGDLLLVLSEEGELHLVELSPERFTELGSIQAVNGKTWNNLCLYGKQLLVRNAEEAACYELP